MPDPGPKLFFKPILGRARSFPEIDGFLADGGLETVSLMVSGRLHKGPAARQELLRADPKVRPE
jgi:hypothetical protein